MIELFHPEVQIWPRGSSNRHFLAPHGISIEPTTFFLRRNKRIKELKRALKWLNALQLLTPTSPFIVKSNLILPRGTKDKHPFIFFSPAYKIEKNRGPKAHNRFLLLITKKGSGLGTHTHTQSQRSFGHESEINYEAQGRNITRQRDRLKNTNREKSDNGYSHRIKITTFTRSRERSTKISRLVKQFRE